MALRNQKSSRRMGVEYAEKLESEGSRRGKGAPTVLFNAKTAVRLVVYGDDFTYSSRRSRGR